LYLHNITYFLTNEFISSCFIFENIQRDCCFVVYLRLWKFQSNLIPQLQLPEELLYQIVLDTFYLTINHLVVSRNDVFHNIVLASKSSVKSGTKPISYSKPIFSIPRKFSSTLGSGVPRRFNLPLARNALKLNQPLLNFFLFYCFTVLFFNKIFRHSPFLNPLTVKGIFFSFILVLDLYSPCAQLSLQLFHLLRQ
jgi:hypothetical protein